MQHLTETKWNRIASQENNNVKTDKKTTHTHFVTTAKKIKLKQKKN